MTRHGSIVALIGFLVFPGAVFAQLGEVKDFVRREKIVKQLPFHQDVERTYRHRQTLNADGESDTPLVSREWTSTHRFLDDETKDGEFVFVTRVTITDVRVDTSVRQSDVADTSSWLFEAPDDHLIVYSSVDNRIYRNEVRELEWPGNKNKIIQTYTDESRLSTRPPWFILPPYSGHCLNQEGITADRCTLGIGPKRGDRRMWRLFLTGEESRSTDEGNVAVRKFLVTFPGGQVIKRRFREGSGLLSERTEAGWSGETKLVNVGKVKADANGDTREREIRNQPNTPVDQPEVSSPNEPNSPNQLPSRQEPSDPNEPNEPSNSDF